MRSMNKYEQVPATPALTPIQLKEAVSAEMEKVEKMLRQGLQQHSPPLGHLERLMYVRTRACSCDHRERLVS